MQMSNVMGNTAGVGWRVTDAKLTSGQDSTGRFTKGWEVTYQLSTGHSGTVFVPEGSFNPDAVARAVDDQAARLYAVVNLSTGP